jgi:hypothetical protein
MRNRSSKTNPYTNTAFSSANKVTGSARGQASAAAKRQVASSQAESAKQVIDFWRSNASNVQASPSVPDLPTPQARQDAPVRRAQRRSKPPSVKVVSNIDPRVQGGQPMAAHIGTTVAEALARFGERVTRVDAHVVDVNGPAKTGVDDIECTLQASLVGVEPVVVKHLAEAAHPAIQGAVNKLKRAVGTALAKLDPRRSAAASESIDDKAG